MDGTPSAKPLKILFVCIGNSCRSQMAEAYAKKLGAGRVLAWSAGSHPLGEIVPKTAEVLAEEGISLAGHWSKSLQDVPVAEMDAVVGMGCEVACPVPVGFKGRVIEWNIPDPFGYELSYFRSIRDLIARKVAQLIDELLEQRQGPPEKESGA